MTSSLSMPNWINPAFKSLVVARSLINFRNQGDLDVFDRIILRIFAIYEFIIIIIYSLMSLRMKQSAKSELGIFVMFREDFYDDILPFGMIDENGATHPLCLEIISNVNNFSK